MKRAFLSSSWILLIILLVMGCRSGGSAAANDAHEQRAFGVRMARMNLWREAMFRFTRAVEMNPEDAMSHNNLAVAYEANGQFDKAEEEYRAAMKLDRSNEYIQKNYSRLREFTQRNKRRDKKPATAAAGAATTATTPAATSGTASAPPPVNAGTASPAAPTGVAPTPVAPTAAAPANVPAPTPAPPATDTAPPAPATPPSGGAR
ncbi:MAG TPA: tetratricopeptide repeat protein [Thermoanaerobaculia bacterium]|nr:tetratricopeptide repeat protein [Thermoanaerobaculia bacterium]